MAITLVIFVVSYAAIALGSLPGFRLDRTGVALVGAIALIATGGISMDAAWQSVSFATMALLFALMVVSATFGATGFYMHVAKSVASLKTKPAALLAAFILTAAVLSAVFTNDVVVLAMTPLLIEITLSRGLNPVPFLLAFCFAANNGSAATLIGSPQNMLIGNGLDLTFPAFLQINALPAILSLGFIWLVMALLYRRRWTLPADKARPAAEPAVPLDRPETVKALVVTLVLLAAFLFTDWPHPVVALVAAGAMLTSRRIASSDILGRIDGSLLLLFFGLFIINRALAETGVPTLLVEELRHAGLDIRAPLPLFVAISLISDIVGNSPAVMMVLPYVRQTGVEGTAAALTLGSAFSSNVVVFGSLAGIIVTEEARKRGIVISPREFMRAGVPVSLGSMALAAAWILLRP
ncbi:MAG: SLC13 family permease [Mesorhizobium sp.]